MYTFDTNAIIYFLKDDPAAVRRLRKIFLADAPIFVSAITEAELFSRPNLTLGESERLEKILGTVVIIPADSRIARLAGALRRTYKIKLPDGIIAATALLTGATLITRNIRDFRLIPGLSLQKI